MHEHFSFGEAIEHVRRGNLIHRKGWANQVVFMRPADEIELETVINKIKSLPSSVKQFLETAHDGELNYTQTHNEGSPETIDPVPGPPIMIGFTRYLCYIDENRDIINGWQPSQEDMLADDWVLV